MIIDYHAHLKWDRETNSYDTEACLKAVSYTHLDVYKRQEVC